MIVIAVYLTLLFIAPQLWVRPFLDVRVDLFLYPLWLVYVVLRGRLLVLIQFRAPDWFFLAFVLWNLLSLIEPGMPERGQKIAFDCAKWFLLYRLTIATTPGMRGVRVVGLLLAAFALVLGIQSVQHMWSESGLGWAGQTFGWVDESASAVGLDRRTRWINIFDGPGVFCVVFTIALPFVLQYLRAPFGWWARAAAVLPAALLLVAIYYTGSRGGWITTLVIIGGMVAMRIGLSAPKLIFLGGLAFALVMLGPSYLTSTRDSSNSAQHRVEMWAQGIEMIQQNPMLGIGRGRFAEYTGSLIAHNSAVEIMGEAGLPGLLFWLGLVTMSIKNTVRAARETEDPQLASHAVALAVSLAGYLVSAMFVTLEYETFYFLLALGVASGEHLDPPPRFETYDAVLILSIVGGFSLALKLFVMAYFG